MPKSFINLPLVTGTSLQQLPLHLVIARSTDDQGSSHSRRSSQISRANTLLEPPVQITEIKLNFFHLKDFLIQNVCSFGKGGSSACY
jgi:hypothetical protein